MTINPSEGNPNMDYQEHLRTYHGFVKGAQYGVGIIALILILMAIFLL